MSDNRRRNRFGTVGVILITLLVLAVATVVLVIAGKQVVLHEGNQTDMIEQLALENEALRQNISEKDTQIAELVAALEKSNSEIKALEDVYSLTSGKVTSMEYWKEDIEEKIAKGEFGKSSKEEKTVEETEEGKEASETETDKKDEDKKKDDKKDDSKKKDETVKEEKPKESKYKGIYQKLVKKKDVKILIVGDSIAEPMDDASWAKLLKKWIKETYSVKCDITNVAISGSTSYCGYVRTMMLPDTDNYDLAIICYGQNDYGYGMDAYYETVIRAIQSKFPNCPIISILESSQREYSEKIQMIQELCAYYNIPVADTIYAFNTSGYDYEALTYDSLHPNEIGKKLYFETLRNIIMQKVEKNEAYVYAERENKACIWKNYDKFTFIDPSQFKITDKLTYEYEGSLSGTLGMYWEYPEGDVGCTIYVDGELLEDKFKENQYPNCHETIFTLSNWINVKHSIKIVFYNELSAQVFRGLAYSR